MHIINDTDNFLIRDEGDGLGTTPALDSSEYNPYPDEEDDDDVDTERLLEALSNMPRQSFMSCIDHGLTQTAHLEYETRYARMAHRDGHHVTVSDGGADTWVLGKGWRYVATVGCPADLVGFDAQARKCALPVIVGCAVVETSQGIFVAYVHHAVWNKDSNITLLSEFQTRDQGHAINLVHSNHWHADGAHGTQCITLDVGVDGSPAILLILRAALMTFDHCEPTDEEIHTLPVIHLTNIQPWDPSRFYSD